eukprot:Rmarinus@m.1900
MYSVSQLGATVVNWSARRCERGVWMPRRPATGTKTLTVTQPTARPILVMPPRQKKLTATAAARRSVGSLRSVGALTEQALESRRAGLHFVRGMLYKIRGAFDEASSEYEMARCHPEWSELACYESIRCCFRTDPKRPFEMPAATGRQLLAECRELKHTVWLNVLECYLYASQGPAKTRQAVQGFEHLIGAYSVLPRDFVPALVGSAVLRLSTAQETVKAIEDLEHISQMEYNPLYGDDFQLAWMLLAHLFMKMNQLVVAESLCRGILRNNPSCVDAWETLGDIFGRTGSPRDAAYCYAVAAGLMDSRNLSLAHHLALALLRDDRPQMAVDVCADVIPSSNEQTAKILREGILLPACAALRLPSRKLQQEIEKYREKNREGTEL